MTEYTNEFMSGKIYWAKVFRPVDNYDKTGKEWAFNFIPDDAGVDILKKHRLLDRLKEGNNSVPEDFLVLKKPERNKDGDKNQPIVVVKPDSSPWDPDTDGLIGNGSLVDVKLTIADFGKGKKKAIWTSAIRVTDVVKYEGGTQARDPFAEFSGVGTTTKTKAKKQEFEKLSDLDEDDMPF